MAHAARESVPPKRAWPEILVSNPAQKKSSFAALLKRTPHAARTDSQRITAKRLRLSIADGTPLPPRGKSGIACIAFDSRANSEIKASHSPPDAASRHQLFQTDEEYAAACSSREHDEASVAAVLQRSSTAEAAHQAALRLRRELEDGATASLMEIASEPLSQPQCVPQLPEQQLNLHVGSSKPHGDASEQEAHRRADRWAHSGSLRHLEPELIENLAVEPLPKCNIPKRTEPEEPPPRAVDPPGPFTTAQLIPIGVPERVIEHGRRVQGSLKRARRGDNGWKQARALRPEAFILEEHEALNPCGWGHVWRQRPDVDLWDAVQPNQWPDDPPEPQRPDDPHVDIEQFIQLAEEEGLTDLRCLSRVKHGFPGAKALPRRAVLGFPHVGALKHPAEFEEMNQRDIAKGFVSAGRAFPEFWPLYADPMNLVIQKGKPRATIDKSIQLTSSTRPEPIEAYNDCLLLEEERAESGGLELPTAKTYGRGAAILQSSKMRVKGGKFDLETFFRIWAKNRAFVHQSGRILETLFGIDWRVNFGEADAPDHCCDGSNAIAFFIRKEWRRLDAEYPTRDAQLKEWLDRRRALAAAANQESDEYFQWCVLAFIIYYIDDGGLAVICDGPLYNSRGEPKNEILQMHDGSELKVHWERGEFYFYVAMRIARRVGHGTPAKKQDPMSFRFELLGIDVDLTIQRLLLSHAKRREYAARIEEARKGHVTLDNGRVALEFDFIRSLMFKLMWASAVIILGKQHLYYLRRDIKAPNRLAWSAVVISSAADRELAWWQRQLERSDSCGVPLASRYDFPCSSESTIVRYSDASREESDPTASGLGGWAVIRGIFLFFEDRWSAEEVEQYSINVLEAKAKDVGRLFIDYASSIQCPVTHSMAYVDNTSSEAVAERSSAQTEGMHVLDLEHKQWLLEHSISETTERVTSIDNDVADMLSRGDVEEALRFPQSAGLPVARIVLGTHQEGAAYAQQADLVQIQGASSTRSLRGVPPTW